MNRLGGPARRAARTAATLAVPIALATLTTAGAAAAPIPGVSLVDGDYGTVGLGSDLPRRYLTITNGGPTAAPIGSSDDFAITGPDARRFHVFDATDCGVEGQALAPGASCRVGVDASAGKRGTSRATLRTPTGEVAGELRLRTVAPTIRSLRVRRQAPGNGLAAVFRVSCPREVDHCGFWSAASLRLPDGRAIGIETGPSGRTRVAGGHRVTVTLSVTRERKWLCYRRIRKVSISVSATVLSGAARSGQQTARTAVRVRPAGCTAKERSTHPTLTGGAR